jgi:hypothetical protein
MKEDIAKMAREADLWLTSVERIEAVERFAALVAARCADIAYEAEPFHSADLIRKAFGVEE